MPHSYSSLARGHGGKEAGLAFRVIVQVRLLLPPVFILPYPVSVSVKNPHKKHKATHTAKREAEIAQRCQHHAPPQRV